MKQFCCGDVVPGCTAKFKGTEADILSAVATHARQVHGMTHIPAPVLDQVRSMIRPSA